MGVFLEIRVLTGCALNEAIKFKKINLSGPPEVVNLQIMFIG